MTYRGGCFCKALRVSFRTRRRPSLRACSCSFCTKHGARSASDPEGSVRFTVRRRYLARFDAHRLVCARCGVYVGIVERIDGRLFAAINVNALEADFDQPAASVDYSGETPARRRARRRALWTPATVVEK